MGQEPTGLVCPQSLLIVLAEKSAIVLGDTRSHPEVQQNTESGNQDMRCEKIVLSNTAVTDSAKMHSRMPACPAQQPNGSAEASTHKSLLSLPPCDIHQSLSTL